MSEPAILSNLRRDPLERTLDRLLNSLITQLGAMSRDTTPESVHESRIAIRRLRVALCAMKPYLVTEVRRRYVAALHDFAADLERSRETDIREASIESLIAGMGIKHQAAAHRLLVPAARQRATAARQLKDLVATLAWRRRLSQLQRYSRSRLVINHAADSLLLIRKAIARHERHLQRALRHLCHKPRKLHRLRLRIKAQRYLEEDFLSALATPPDRQLKRLRKLQDRLGEYHDNWCLKKWLGTQAASHAIARGLRGELNAQQEHLFKAIHRLCRRVRKLGNT